MNVSCASASILKTKKTKWQGLGNGGKGFFRKGAISNTANARRIGHSKVGCGEVGWGSTKGQNRKVGEVWGNKLSREINISHTKMGCVFFFNARIYSCRGS